MHHLHCSSITSDLGAGDLLRAVRGFGRVIFIMSGTKRQTRVLDLFQPFSRTDATGGRCGGLPSRGARIFQKQKVPSWKNIDAAERWTVKTESTRCNKRSYVDELQQFFEGSLSA